MFQTHHEYPKRSPDDFPPTRGMVIVLLALALLVVLASVALAQKDRMQLGETLGATVKRGFGAAIERPKAIAPPASQDRLTTQESLTPTKGAR